MSTIEIVSKIEALKEWEALAEEAAAEIEALKDSIKREMDARGVEQIEAGQYIARFTTVQSSRFDMLIVTPALIIQSTTVSP